MGAGRIIILIVAAVSAIGLALLVRGLAGHPAARPAPVVVAANTPQPMAQVLVARRDLPVGKTLAQDDVTWQPWPIAALNPAFITDGQAPQAPPKGATAVAGKVANAAATVMSGGGPAQALMGSIVREPILANEPITNVKLVRGGEGGYMAVVLHPGMRAVAVPVNVGTAAGGFILPGDRVDLLQSHQADAGAGGAKTGMTAQTLLRNIRVLAIDQITQPPKGSPSVIGAVATLEVAAADAEVVARAKAQGEVVLALRAYSDSTGPSGRAGGQREDTGEVHIFRNGVSTTVTVTP
jgi:pilus assembly protein CpaB